MVCLSLADSDDHSSSCGNQSVLCLQPGPLNFGLPMPSSTVFEAHYNKHTHTAHAYAHTRACAHIHTVCTYARMASLACHAITYPILPRPQHRAQLVAWPDVCLHPASQVAPRARRRQRMTRCLRPRSLRNPLCCPCQYCMSYPLNFVPPSNRPTNRPTHTRPPTRPPSR